MGVDEYAIFITVGFAREPIVSWLKPRIEWIAPAIVYPGEGEMIALAEAALRVLRGEEEIREYADYL